jgi:predicted ATP-dependent endonuclease of OLD family
MHLLTVTIQKFKNFVEPQRIDIEGDVTCLVGKNESGKTTILTALHRLNPANGDGRKFDLTTEYPRWRLARDRRADPELNDTHPIEAEFSLSEEELTELESALEIKLPVETTCHAVRSYADDYYAWLSCGLQDIFHEVAEQVSLTGNDLTKVTETSSVDASSTVAKELAKELKESGEALRAKALTAYSNAVVKYKLLTDSSLFTDEQLDKAASMVPRFFYFSQYSMLPGECDLNDLAGKVTSNATLTEQERTVIALLAHAGEKPEDFMDSDYDSRKAELQAASVDLSRSVFKYWKQNTDLEVIFDTDNIVVATPPNSAPQTHRILKIELRDGRHGNVETNFSTRSSGFQWFFSFFAAFSEYQNSNESIIVLLDEPGTSLHGDAQRDFVSYIFDELGASKQTLYTTHSQHMIDPTKYEKLRAVHDRATRSDPDQGVAVTLADLAADRDTILPIESALGYSISQHLFIGSGQHLAVEGSSDFVYLQRMTEYLVSEGETGLDPRLAIIPVGGDGNMPAFVAILGRRLKVSALIDGAKTSSKLSRVKAAAKDNGVPESAIIACSEAHSGLPTNSDIEDLFDPSDYLKLYNWAFNKTLSQSDLATTTEPIVKRITDIAGEYDHALPAHALTMHREEFFASLSSETIARFKGVFEKLNSTVSD